MNPDRDTIFALSSGSPPAAVAIIRISGPRADAALQQLAGKLPDSRRASLAPLRDLGGEVLDTALILRFPGPNSATGEDLTELHLHGGRAVVAAVSRVLADMDGLRAAEPGEFTRRTFENGRIDLAEAEGLADLLASETEGQRRAALALAGGSLGRMVHGWQERLLLLEARVEAVLDFSDEGEVGEALPLGWLEELNRLVADMEAALARPPAERLRDGIRAVIAGPPNAGKSSLLNALIGREAAITSAIPGTTRDLVEAAVALAGIPFILIDTAGLRDSADEIESLGVERAHTSLATADIVLWLGDADQCPEANVLLVDPKADLFSEGAGGISVSSVTGTGLAQLVESLVDRAKKLLPVPGEAAMNARHRKLVADALGSLSGAQDQDFIILAESLRSARAALNRITGGGGTEDMLDQLFGRMCIGK